MQIILNYPIEILIVTVIIISLMVYIYKNKKGLLYKTALYAVSVAEKEWGSNTGKIKFAEVYTYIKKTYPLFTLLFTEKVLTTIIEEALLEMKNILNKYNE